MEYKNGNSIHNVWWQLSMQTGLLSSDCVHISADDRGDISNNGSKDSQIHCAQREDIEIMWSSWPSCHRPMGICSTLLSSCILHIPVCQLKTHYRYVHHQTYHMMLPIISSKITLSLYWSLSHFIKTQFRILSNCNGSHNGRTGAVIARGKLTFYYPSMEGEVYNKSNELLE